MKITEKNECVITGDILKLNEKTQETDITKISGIYKIINKVNGKYYVGSSNDITGKWGRWQEHRNELNKKKHSNDHLQKSWNKYGENNFDFVIIERNILNDQLLIKEQIYLDIAKKERDRTYNISFIAGRIDMTPEVTSKIARWLSEHRSGVNHSLFDSKIYTFRNKITGNLFRGTRYHFIKKFNLNTGHMCSLLQGKRKSHRKWILVD